MFNKIILIATIIFFSGCSDFGEKLKVAIEKGMKKNSSKKSNKMTKKEYIEKCEKRYGKDNPPNICKDLVTIDSTSRCMLELSIKNGTSSSQAMHMCEKGTYNTHFLDDYKKPEKETMNSCMEENEWRHNSTAHLYNFCKRKIERRDSKYIE